MLQYSARNYYNRAERFATLSWLVCIANLIVKIPYITSLLGVWAVVFPMAVSIFLIPILSSKTKEYTQIGAATRQLIDYKLFGFAQPLYYNNYTEDQLKEYAAIEKNNHIKDYTTQISHCGTEKEHGVKDWYSIDNNMQHEQAVRECQRQNKMFDDLLTKALYLVIVLILVVVAILFVILYGNNTVNDAILSLSFVIPLITKASGTVRGYFELWQFNIRWKKTFSKPNVSNEERQSCIDERRRMVFIVPHILHSFQSNKLHNIVSDSMKE